MKENARVLALEVKFIKKASKTNKKIPLAIKAEKKLEKV